MHKVCYTYKVWSNDIFTFVYPSPCLAFSIRTSHYGMDFEKKEVTRARILVLHGNKDQLKPIYSVVGSQFSEIK